MVLGIVAFICFAMMSSSAHPSMDGPRLWILALVSKCSDNILKIERWFSMEERNRELLQANAALALKNARLNDALSENERLKGLLDFAQESPLRFTPARVVGISSRGFITSIVLNMGSEQGLAPNMPLMTDQGLAGKLYSVGKTQSLGQLLIDVNFRVSARVQRSRTTGIVRWLRDTILLMELVPKRSDVQVGDVIVTSGLTPMFPKGLRIGVVTEVLEDEPGLFMTIKAKPFVDFSTLEELFVIHTDSNILALE